MARFVPIIIQVKGGEDANRVARQIVNAFKEIDKGADSSSKSTEQSGRKTTNAFKQIEQEAGRSAKGVSSSFSTYLSAHFFAQLGRDALNAFFSFSKDFVTKGIQLAQDMQNALLGVGSVAAYKGIDQQAAQDALQGLRLVKAGIITVGDAATGLKNLLQAGFGLDQSITLLERFSDTAAFGKQAALTYGDAIRSATEGIKNQNSILVDNAGITKNIEIMLKERGFTMQDLADKQKGLNAREALYAGLLEESKAQLGDSEKLINTYTGSVAAQDMAYQNLQRTIGEQIISNREWVEATKITTEFLNETTAAVKNENSETAKFAKDAIYWAAIIKATLPSIATVIFHVFSTAFKAMAGLAAGFQGLISRSMEILVDLTTNAGAKVVNTITGALNQVLGIARKIPASLSYEASVLAAIPDIPQVPVKSADFGGDLFFREMRSWFDATGDSMQRIGRGASDLEMSVRRINAAADRRDWNVTGGVGTPRGTGPGTDGGGTGAGKAADRKSKIDEENIRQARKAFGDLGEAFAEKFGRSMPARWGPSSLHRRQGMDHRAAADIGLNPNSPEGQWVKAYLEENNIPFSAWTQRTVSKVTGKVLASGPHIHFGAPSGKPFGQVTEGLTGRELDEAIAAEEARKSHRFYGKSMSDIASMIRDKSATRPIETTEPELAGLPPSLQRLWDNYYDHISQREKETAARREDFATEFYAAQQNLALDLENIELDLAQFRKQNTDDQFVDHRRLLSAKTEEYDLLQRTAQVQDEIANGPYNESLRIQLALLEDIANMRRRDEEAIIASNRAQLELADATTYHATQANARVLEFLASQTSITDIVADAKVGVIQTTFDYIDRGLDKWTQKLGAVGGLVKQIASDFIRLALLPAFMRMFGLSAGGGGGQAAGGGGFFQNIFGGGGGPGGTPTFAGGFQSGGGSISQQLFGMLRRGGGTQYAAGMPFLGSFGTEGISAPTSTLSSMGGILHSQGDMASGAHAGMSAAPSLLGGGVRGGLAALLPMLGVGLGAQLGGQSRFGSILGGAGGLLAGGIGTALLAPALFGIGTAGGSSALMAGLFGLLTNPFTAVVAGALLVGAILLNRNAVKRKNETDRAALNSDTYSQVIQVLNDAQAGRFNSPGAAIAAFDQIKSQYFARISKYDSKTKRIATDVWNDNRNGFEYYRPLIKKAAEDTALAQTRSSKLIPEFVTGGAVFQQISATRHLRFADGGFSGRMPGMFDGRDNHLIAVSGNEVVLNPRQWGPIAPYLKAVRVPGFAGGGAGANASPSAGSSEPGDIVFNVRDDRTAALLELIFEGMESPGGKKITVKTVAGAQRSGRL